MFASTKPAYRRFWLIDCELRAGRYPTLERLAELTEADPRTIQRDLDEMRDQHHAPIQFNRKRRGYEYTEATYRLPALLMTEGELVAMFLAGQVLKQHEGTPYESQLRQALGKLTELLPDEVSVQWDTVAQAHSFHQSVTTLQDVDTFRRLADAVLHHKQLRITYWAASREEQSERVIDPWHLACINGEWYLIAWCHRRHDRRMFAPGRIKALEPTGQSFAVPDDFRIGEFFDGTFRVISDSSQPLQTVRLRFAPSAAKYIREKVWHVSQVLHAETDGHVVLELSLRSLIEVRRWILSWGRECEVLEPESLRDDIRQEAAAMLEQSQSAPTVERVPSRTRRSSRQRQQTG